MAAPEPVHRGQLLAHERTARTVDPDGRECDYCGRRLDADRPEQEEVTHRIERSDGTSQTRRYCSPSCFIRDHQESSVIPPRTDA